MNNFATTVLNVIDKAIGGQSPWPRPHKDSTPRECTRWAEQNLTREQINQIAGDARPYSLKYAKAIKAHVLGSAAKQPISGAQPAQESAAKAAGTPVAFPLAGRPGIQKSTSIEAHSALAAMPDPSVRYRALKVLDALDISIRGDEPDEVLVATAQKAQADVAAKQKAVTAALEAAAAQTAAAAPSSPWNIQTLTALTDAVYGRGTARAETFQASACPVGPGTTSAKLAASVHSAAAWEVAHRAAVKEARARAVEKAGPAEQARQVECLKALFLKDGLTVPGLSFAGMSVPENHRDTLGPESRKIAQGRVDAFANVILGDEEAGRSPHPAAAAARQFIASVTKRPFVIGMTPKTQSQTDSEKYPFSTIPRL